MATTPIFVVKPVFEHELFPLIQAMTAAYNEDNGADLTTFEIQTTRVLNKIITDSTCVRFFTTLNIDKPLFGVYVSPTIIDTELNQFIYDPNQVIFDRYSVELDRKLFDILTPEEIAAYLIEDITTTMSKGTINNTRALFNTIIADRDMSIDLKKSVNFEQLLIFGIKDTIRKVSSLLYKPVEAMGINEYAREFEYSEGVIPNIAKKLHTSLFDMNGLTVNPKLSVLSWVLTVYNEPNINYELTLDALTSAAVLTGSKLEQDEVEKTITSLRRASNETLTESKVESLREGMSIFKNLKQNGLRSIEDDLYEYKIRIKNCETEDDAMYILQQINTRINILEDYLYNTSDLSAREVQRWENVINAYRDLRAELSKKKIADKKRYGIYIDYNSFDKLENESAMFDAAVGDPNDKDFTESFMTEAKDDEDDKKPNAIDKANDKIEDGLNPIRQKIISSPKTDQGKKDLEILKDICKKYSKEGEKTNKLDSKTVSELEANIKKRISPDSLSAGSVKNYHVGGKVYMLPYTMKKGGSQYQVTISATNNKFRLYKFAEKTNTKSGEKE